MSSVRRRRISSTAQTPSSSTTSSARPMNCGRSASPSIGSYAGAPVITSFGLPLGTYEFRSPEAYLFNRSNPELVHYEFSATDELWALGVTFYWLLCWRSRDHLVWSTAGHV